MEQFCPSLISCKPLSNEFSHLKEIKLTTPCVSIGRGLGNALQIPCLTISRYHCKLMKKDDYWFIEDNSTFGIHVNNTSVGKGNVTSIKHGDTITLDPGHDFMYKFLCEDEGPPRKLIKLDADKTMLINEVTSQLQNNEIKHIKEKNCCNIKLENTKKMLVNTEKKMNIINNKSATQHENLKGDKSEIQKQQIFLAKGIERIEAIAKHNATQKIEQIVELQGLINQKKVIESDLNTEVIHTKEDINGQVEIAEKKKCDIEVQLNEQIEAMKKIEEKEKTLIDQLRHEKEEMCKILIESQKDSEKAIAELKAKVATKLEGLAALTNERIQKQTEQSTETISSLQDQLTKVASDLENIKHERRILIENIPSTSVEYSKQLGEIGDLMENELQCSICAELFIYPTTLNCSHSFCQHCITMWKKKKKDCPICRTPIKSECRTLALDSFIEKMVEKLSSEMKQKRQETLKARIEIESNAVLQENMRRRNESEEEDSEYEIFEEEEEENLEIAFIRHIYDNYDEYFPFHSGSDSGSDY